MHGQISGHKSLLPFDCQSQDDLGQVYVTGILCPQECEAYFTVGSPHALAARELASTIYDQTGQAGSKFDGE